MSFRDDKTFTRENLDSYLRELAKEYRRLGGKNMPAELTIIGGASVLINYGFRNTTTDIDAMIHAASTMKEAINRVGLRCDLPKRWLNDDFRKTDSYTPKVVQYSKYYKSYYGVMTIRTVAAEYLIAMKLASGRQYKNDLSDIAGILAEHEKSDQPITMDMIRQAVIDLYDEWDIIPETSREFIADVMNNGDYNSIREEIMNEEKEMKDALIEFENNNPGAVNRENFAAIVSQLKKKREE